MGKKKIDKNIILILIISVLIMLPMIFTKYFCGHDTVFHFSNIINLSQQIIKNFINPSKIVSGMANNFGYGTELFYPPLAHFVAAYLNVIFNNVLFSMEIVYLISFFLSGITMYYLSKKLSKNNTIALVSAIIYMLFPYHITDVYIRDAMAESLLFIFLPMIISGLYELYYGNKKKFYVLFIIGYVGGMLSHLTMMVYFTGIIIIFLICKLKDTIKYLKQFIISAFFILAIASPFLITLIEHKFLGDYSVFIPGHMNGYIWWMGLLPNDYLDVFKMFGNNDVRYYIDIITLILLVITIYKYKKLKPQESYKYIIYFGLISFFLSSRFFFWDLLPNSLRIIQFPWRFETLVAISVSLLAPLCLKNVKDRNVILIIVFLLVAVECPILKHPTDELISKDNYWRDGGMGYQQEYLPASTYHYYDYYEERDNSIIVKDGEATIGNVTDSVPFMSFDIETSNVTIELPRIYYIGYNLKDSKGNKIKIKEDKYGFICADITKSDTYYLRYNGTFLDNACKVVSVASIIILFVWRKHEKD